MGSVTIRIEPQQEPGKTDFDVHLIEEDGNQTSGCSREPADNGSVDRKP